MKKRLILCMLALAGLMVPGVQAKDLVVYFSATGNTQAVAEEIARLTGADLLRIEAAEPYATNPYDDSDRIQREAYGDQRPGVANLPDAETLARYDRLFVGSPIWWHQPAMVVCTFLESYDLTGKTVVPFFTYGATTYLNESMQKIYKVTPASRHVPETLPEDLDADDITTPGRPDDSGIDMPGSARGVEAWLRRLGLLGSETAIGSVQMDGASLPTVEVSGGMLRVGMPGEMETGTVEIRRADGTLAARGTKVGSYTFSLPAGTVYLVSFLDGNNRRLGSRKVAL